MTTAQDRLKEYISYKGLSMRKFEMAAGVPIGYVKNIKYTITPEKQTRIANAFKDLNIGWLTTGEGSMLREQPQVQMSNSNVNYHSPHATIYASDIHTIKDIPTTKDAAPLVPIELTRKENTDIYNEMMRKSELTSEHITKVNVFSEIDFYFMVCDDAMSPNFVRGDYIALRHLEPGKFIINGYPYVLDTKTHGMFLRILKERSDHYECSVVAQSERYEAFNVPKEDVYMVYNVKGLVRTSF